MFRPDIALLLTGLVLTHIQKWQVVIGRHELSEMLEDRDRLGREIQQVLDKKTDPWGITIQSIEIRDIIIPKGLEDAMSRQAERERPSRPMWEMIFWRLKMKKTAREGGSR